MCSTGQALCGSARSGEPEAWETPPGADPESYDRLWHPICGSYYTPCVRVGEAFGGELSRFDDKLAEGVRELN